MTIAVGQELNLDFEFKPAGVQEAVTVVGTAPVLDLSSAHIGVNVSERDVNNLPVNGRQMSQLMLQAPGSQNAGTGTWQDIRFSGRAVEQNAIRYDGIEGSAIIDAAPGNLNGEVATPFKLQASLENVQEFRVESSAYPAEFGTGSGGQVSVITKSGANVFHGSAFEYLRRDGLDSRNYFDYTRNSNGSVQSELPKSLLKQDQFGGSVGGPIREGSGVLLRQLRGLPAGCGHQHHRGRAERLRLVARHADHRVAASRLPGAGRLHRHEGRSGRRPRHRADPDAADRAGGLVQRPSRPEDTTRSGRATSAFFADRGTSDQPNNVAGQIIHTVANPVNGVASLQGILSNSTTNEFKFGYNGAPTQLVGLAPVVNGFDFSDLHHQHDRFGREQRHRGPGRELGHHGARRPDPREQRTERPRAAVRSVHDVVHRLAELDQRQSLPQGRRRVSA